MKKIVDENGKLFRKFNLVDAIVVLLVAIILIAAAWKGVSAARTAAQERANAKNTHEAYMQSPHLIYKVVCDEVPLEVAESCKQQMELPMEERQLMSNGKSVEGYITDCSYEPMGEHYYWLYFTIETLPTVKDGIYSVGSQEVRVGKSHIVKTYNIETTGWVYEMEEPANE